MPTEKSPKKKRSFTISPNVFIKLKVYSSQKGIPYSIILEALADSYIENPSDFPVIHFERYI